MGIVLLIYFGVEKRLLWLAYFLPERTIYCDHGLAENRLQAFKVFLVIVYLVDENVANMLEIAQEIDLFLLQFDGKATTASLTHPHENLHRILRAEEG